MKKWMLVLVALIVSVSAFSQSCLDDVWQCLKSKQVPKAKKFMESCMASNPDNAAVWLMQANVNIQLYNYDSERMQKDASLAPRYPNALEDAYAAFVKAVELDSKVEPKSGMFGPKEGQQILAQPFQEKAVQAKASGKLDEAVKYYGLSARCYELAQKKADAAAMYLQTALVYNAKGDRENYEKLLEKSVSTAPEAYVDAYVELYYLYSSDKDTAKCGEILNKAGKIFKDEARLASLYEPMMDYYAMIGDEAKLLELCDKVIASGNEVMIPKCATYLSNAKSYAKAEQILRDALAKNPNDFNLLKQMGYRYALEYYDIQDRRQAAMNARQYEEATRLFQSPERKAAMENAHEWCQRAYEVNPDDLENNRILREMKALLQIPIPQELNDKINARMQSQH
jgi:tetratricopeptide (TPR) repeat protein